MDLLANELSVHGQFRDNRSFGDAIGRLMKMWKVAQRHGHEIHCARRFRDVEPRPGVRLEPALQRSVGPDERRLFLHWLTRGGPFWDDSRRHGPDAWLECRLECREEVVTDTSVGEAAFRVLSGMNCGLVSLTPSDWDFTPVHVCHRHTEATTTAKHADLPNWRCAAALEEGLRGVRPDVRAWNDLRREMSRYPNLRFAPDCLDPLDGLPFSDGASREILRRLEVLNRFAGLVGDTGAPAHERLRLHQKHFRGRKAWFSDSSDEEKTRFRAKMNFRHPDRPGERLFCPWHGKVKIQQIRIHFSWPEPPIHVVYVGQKITRR